MPWHLGRHKRWTTREHRQFSSLTGSLAIEPILRMGFQRSEGGFMKAMLKVLLVIAVAGLVIGIMVTSSRARLDPIWTLALPVGVSFVGLFLISFIWRDELARFDAEEHAKHDPAMHHPPARADAAAPAASPGATRAGALEV